jgi:hypothetical protein
MKKVFLLFTIAYFLLLNLLNAQKTFSREELLDDMDSLYVMINEVHPDMFAFLSKEAFEEQLDQARLLVRDGMTVCEFFKVIALLVAALGDGHTSVYFPYTLWDSKTLLIPFEAEVQYADSSVFVIRDYSDPENAIPVSAKVMRINKKDMKKMVSEMLTWISGEQDFYKVATLNQRFRELMYIAMNDTVFKMVYNVEGKEMEKTIPARSYGHIFHAAKKADAEKQQRALYYLDIDEENEIAIIYFNGFDDLSRFEIFADSAFSVIREREIGDLIIDIRENNGGDSRIGDEFFQYISPVPFEQFGKVIMRVSPRQMAFAEKYHGWTFGPEDTLGSWSYEVSELNALRDNPLRFQGDAYLLTSHYTFSSASSFAWAFQYFEMGKVIGEETGGMVVSFGDVIPQFLPNTRMQFGTSHKKFYHYGATDNNIHGTIPDHQVPVDQAMDHAVDLILRSRR